LRPPVADERIRLTETGQVLLELRHRWRDGTTHLLLEPIELLERLAALTPRPRVNLVRYYGVLAGHAACRSRLRTAGAGQAPSLAPGRATIDDRQTAPTPEAEPPPRAVTPRSNLLWAQLMARSSRLRRASAGLAGALRASKPPMLCSDAKRLNCSPWFTLGLPVRLEGCGAAW
jgi:hypothetical protein